MICKPCAQAGDLQKKLHDDEVLELQVATELHQQCEGCDCQHRINGLRIAMKAKRNGNS